MTTTHLVPGMDWRALLADWADKLAIWHGYEDALRTLLIYGVGIALYTVLVFAFYQNISKRDAFVLKHRPGAWGRMMHFVETSLVFPLMSFLYFGVLAASLFILAKSQSTFQIMLLAMSVVVGVRVCAFVSENASVDLAKMLPLALLGVLVVDPSYTSLQTTWNRVLEVPTLLNVLWRFFVLFIVLETALRTTRSMIVRVATRPKKARKVTKHELIEDATTH